MIDPTKLTAENGFVEGCVVEYERYNTYLVEKLIAHSRALEAMLRQLEWAGTDSMDNQCCPLCKWNESMNGGHSPDCALAKLLE